LFFFTGGLRNQLFHADSSFGIAQSSNAQWCIPYLENRLLAIQVCGYIQPRT
jgi:hypothetical protein